MAEISTSQLVNKVLKGFWRENGTAHKKHDAATVEIVRYLLNTIVDDNSPQKIRGSYGTLFTRILKGEHMTDERFIPQIVRLIVKHIGG